MPSLADIASQMGGMSSQPPQPTMQPPTMGQPMMGQPMAEQPQQGWNGVVNVQGQPVEVRNGVGVFQGKKYFVSNDGKIVADEQRNFIGMIQNGNFVKATPQMAKQLKEQGILE